MRLVLLLALVARAVTLEAQASTPTPEQPATPVFSMGQPPVWQPFAAAFGVIGRDNSGGGGALFGVNRPILNPVTGLLSAGAEVYGDRCCAFGDAGLRLIAHVPVMGLGIGADWNVQQGGVATILTFQSAIRRGGIFGHGSMLRLDWLPARGTFDAGLTVPLAQPFAGRTRPRATNVTLPSRDRPTNAGKDLPASATQALGEVARTGAAIRGFTSLYSTADQTNLVSNAQGRSYDETTLAYHTALRRAFSAVLGDSTVSDRVAAQARVRVLDDVLLPYDALFGQEKHEGIGGLTANAHDRFARWIGDSSSVSQAMQSAALSVFDRWLDILADAQRSTLTEWKDSRLVWLPLQLALLPEEYDEQPEVDALIGRAVGHPFTNGNIAAYLRTADLPAEIARSILAARRYHLLWTHDFTGRLVTGRLDEISCAMVADAYLPALTAAVKRYDSTGVMPQYMILIDAFYYHARDGALWMSILEDPLHAPIRLRANEQTQAAHLRERVDSLRAAVAKSTRLQREAATHGGDRWISEVVKVHVNVMQPSDFSFRSGHTVPPIPFTADNIIRDHRKLVITDVTESNPYDGELLVTGIGIGEHYASATWEDRGYRLRGPAALEARVAIRKALTANGFTADQIPGPLQPSAVSGTPAPPPPGRGARLLQVHNQAGYAPKESSVARAMLYTLAPPGSVIIVPDPLWLSDSWGALLGGAAARGSTVVIIAPSLPNSPSPEPSVAALENDLLHHMLEIHDFLDRHPVAGSGQMRVGLYTTKTPVTDVAGRAAEVRAGLARAPWIRQLIPFDSSALAVLNRATAQVGRADASATELAHDDKPREPQLHQKTQMIARPGAIAALVSQPGWDNTLAQSMRVQSQETAQLSDVLNAAAPPADTAAARAADSLFAGFDRSLSATDRTRLSFYFSVGTMNEDPRGLMLDAETTVIVSGFDASSGLVDLFYLMARSTFVERPSEIDQLIPRPRGIMARLAHLVRFAM